MLALLRCIITEGQVYFDGILTSAVNLDALRTSIAIIPQIVSPVLLFSWKAMVNIFMLA